MDHGDHAAELRRRLWNDGEPSNPVEQSATPRGRGTYDEALLDQYSLYVEMADRVSPRRALANTFFLSLNTGIFALVALVWRQPPDGREAWLAVPVAALLGQCLAWFYLVRSYRQLNTAKFEVVGALEERLPASPYWKAEWWALGEGKDLRRYWPLSHLEQWLPLLFAVTYLGGYVALLLS